MVDTNDPRCQYIANTASAILGNMQLAQGIAQSPELHQFLNELNVRVLQIISDGKKFRAFANQVANIPPGALECHFVKLAGSSEELDPQKIQHQVMTSSLRNSSVQSLHAYLNTVYGPVLFGAEGAESKKTDPQLRDLLFSLKAGLQRTLRKGGKDLQKVDFNEDEFRGILSPMDEIECWQELERENIGNEQNSRLHKRAETISRHFTKVAPQLTELDTLDLGQVSSLVDSLQDTLDQIWRDPELHPAYSQQRMEHLFRVTTKALGSRIEKEFKENDIWQSSFSEVRVKLNECMRICRGWKDRTTELTREFWRGQNEPHKWQGKPFYDSYLENVIIRIGVIFELRSQHDELLRLLSSEEREKMKVGSTFDPFRKINSFYTNEFQTANWQRAMKEYEAIMEPMEKEICQKLRSKYFSDAQSSASQQLREFQRWKGLLSKESIKLEMQQDRETLLSLLVAEVQKFKDEFNMRTGQSLDSIPGMEKPPQSTNVTETVSAIIWSRQLSLKVQNNLKLSKGLFADLGSMKRLEADSSDLCESIKEFETNLFTQWVENIKRTLQDPQQKAKYEMSGQLMEFDYQAGGLLKVNYSERLVSLVKEARVLGEHGFKIPKAIHTITENAKKFYKEGVTLKQAANFFNSMGTQMIECQKPMMIEKATQFENLIKNPKGQGGVDNGMVTWSDPIEIQQYNEKIQAKTTDLIAENRKLSKVHHNVIEMINELMNIDLLNNRQTWKTNLQKIRKIVDSVTRQRPAEYCRLWLTHLNFQLFKALEHQYQIGLESLNESLPEFSTSLVYRNQNLEFRPTFEELKQNYYHEMQLFIMTPLKFSGIGGQGTKQEIFKMLPDMNSKHLKTVYFKAEELFSKLQLVVNEYRPWTALGSIDLQQHIEQHFDSVQDWVDNFEMLRQKRRELKKLPDSTKVDCVTVNLVPFKSGIDSLFRQLQDALVDTLEDSIERDSEIVRDFIQKGLEKLNSNPQSVEEIEQMHNDAIELGVERESIVQMFDGCEQKNKMIKQMKGTSMQLGEIESMWKYFDARLAQFNDKIEDQKARLVQELDNRVRTLNADLEKMFDKWNEKKPKERNELTYEDAMETSEIMKELRQQWTELQDRINKANRDCQHFGKPKPQFTYYDKMKEELEEQNESWALFEEFRKQLDEFGKEEWLTYRKKGYFAFQDFFIQQSEALKMIKNRSVVVRFLLKQIEDYKQAWPLMKLCTGESFEREHWRKLISMLQMPKEVTLDNMKFIHLVDAVPLMLKKSKDLKDLADKAQGEVTIREAINELRVWSETTEFVLTEHKSNGRTTQLIKEWKEVMTQVSDNQSLIMSLKESRFYAGFADQVSHFEQKFGGIDDHLAKLNVIQRKWVYLEPIFMRGALPQEQGRFRRVDEEYRAIALGIGADPLVMSLCEVHGLKDTLETILTQLDLCQKALNDYLEEKRQKFSRFYFIGDDDLLEILGQAHNPAVIQSHLKKLFSGIHKVAFNKENDQMKSMISSQSEYVPLNSSITIQGDVEVWLLQLEQVMRDTLDLNLKDALKAGQLDINNMPSQICCLAEMINFSQNCVNAIKQGKLANYKGDLQKQLESYTSFDHKGNMLLFSKLKALILDIIHNIEVVGALMNDQISQTKNPNDWMWFKQLRYAVDARSGQALVGMADAFFDYSFEYQGNAQKLVHTPLTDKCYLTLVMGMKLGYGGNPYGPAGTGKTESVKALGQAFGRQVLVFNCDEGLDYKAMGRIFIGLVKCGAWGCFDEFNRLLEEQLSAISQQIQVIQYAIKEGQSQLSLLGRVIPVNKNAGIFVTLNPAGKGYGGRSKLPDNLKQLFRPVAMSAPDIEQIAEVLLFAEGFKEAKKLSTKIVSLFKLCKQLLSTQRHYDWELRAQKTIFNTAGPLIQQELKKGRNLKYEDEAQIFIKAMRVNTMSKLTYNDTIKYEALQADMFPKINSADIDYADLDEAIFATIQEMKLQNIDKQIMKIKQFYEATKRRMGVIIVGPSGCGKTTIWQIMKKAYEKMNVRLVTHVMNPKSMPREQLLGLMNHDTREFQDGVLTSSARSVVKEPQETICWIICDGDIDPEWIESLNSVLDDNHLLTLPNGERISFGDNVNFIFETNDLRYASPATVTRLGMIFLAEEDVDVQRMTKTWTKKQPEDMQNKLDSWMEEILMPSLDWVLQRQKHLIVETTKVGIVNNALTYLSECKSKAQFTYGVLLGLGGNFKYNVRMDFAKVVLEHAQENVPDQGNPLNNFYDIAKQTWGSFVLETPPISIQDLQNPENPPLVNTPSIQKDIAQVRPLLESGQNFVLCGPEGCGKNLIITSLIAKMRSTQLAIIHCNAQTSAFQVIQKLNQMCSQSTNSQGRVYRPKECQRLIIYLKDINLPKPDKYESIQLISFLQQIVCYQGFYDTNLDFVSLERITIVASMNPSTTIGRHKISTRFTANVRLVYMDYSAQEELVPVYNLYLKTILAHPRLGDGKLTGSTRRLATFMIDLFGDVRQRFSVDDHRHYQYTPREITNLIFMLLRYEIPDAQTLIETLIYECQRVFKDRLVDRASKKQFDTLMYQHIQGALKFKGRLDDTFFLSKITQGQETLIPGIPNLGRIPKADFIALIEQSMRAYEREFKELSVHLIEEILEMIANIERVLSMPGGSLLLAGRAGVGRKQSTQLIAHILNMEFFSPNINREYAMKEFKRDLKVVLQTTGINAEKVCLFIEDHQLIQTEFLEMLNSLISAGEIPGLYTPEELEPLLQQLSEEMRNQYTYRTPFEFFVSRIKKNLSVVISLDNTHPDFTKQCAQNPSLFNKCVIIWNDGWSKESLKQVSRAMLSDVSEILEDKAEKMIDGALYLQAAASDKFDVSPASFVNFMSSFSHILKQISSSRGGQTKHLIAGLGKLEEAATNVDKLSQDANIQKKKLTIAQKEANEAMQKIQISLEKKAERKAEVETLQAGCARDEEAILERKSMVEGELSHVQPEVDKAKAAVGELKPAHLNEIKGFRVPPPPVEHVLGAVMQFLGQSDISWNGMKRFLSNAGVIGQILNFDARQVTPALRKKVDKVIRENPQSFEYERIYNVSRACAGLASWVVANVTYSEVLLKIEPLTSELDGLMRKLEMSQARVNECQIQLQELQASSEQLQNEFNKKTTQAVVLGASLKKAEETLESAMSLLTQLSGENERWKKQVMSLTAELSQVPIRSLLASAFMTYLAPENEKVREATLQDWCQTVQVSSFNFRNFLSSEAQMLTWKKEGLPADSLSQENAIMIVNAQQTPLIIDPATQASEWLKVMLKKTNDNLEILSNQDPKFNTNIELAIRFGKVLVVQEVDGIESMLVPILRKDLIQQGPRQVVQIGEKAVDYNPNFRLYLTTRDQFMKISPNTRTLVTMVNFTVTKSGLEGQLLSNTINFEQPELEKRKTQILEEEEGLKIQLAGFEKQLLMALANSTGNILENKDLIESLNQTKIQSSQIEVALQESEKLQVSLDQQREVYRNFAIIGSNLFMVFGDLIKMNNMYQFSLASFVRLFNRALETRPQANSTEEKLEKLSNSLVKLCFSEIGRSLFKADRLTYALYFVKGVYPEFFGLNEWEFFNGQSTASTESHIRLPQWVSKDRKDIFAMFVNSFANLVANLQLDNEQMWAQFAHSQQPELEFPHQITNRVTPFQRCILIQVLRPDRLESGMNQFVKEAFGNQVVQPAPFSLSRLYESESYANEPVLFIISPGSDPSAELQEYAEQVVGRACYHELAMGGGQNEVAIETIKSAAQKGEWVCLKNLHLVTPWLSVLEKEFKMLTPDKKFRLWLTSEAHPKFPSILLQSSLKITYETPPGMRNNLQRTFGYVTPSQQQGQPANRMQLLFILSWFHSLIQERRTYIPQGWVKYYEFSYGDLKAGESILSDVLKESGQNGVGAIPWQKIYGILENAIYGGRVDNSYDMRVLRTYMLQMFSDQTLKGQKALSNTVNTPQSPQPAAYVQTINQLAEQDQPSLFGLPANIDRSVQRFNSAQVILQLKSLQAANEEQLHFDKEKWTQQLSPICQLWQNVFRIDLFKQVKISGADLRAQDPVDQFVFMEMVAVKKILGFVNESIGSIVKVLKGAEMLTPKIQQEAMSLLKNSVPETWEKQWEGPENPSQWIRVLCKKGTSLIQWVQRVQQKQLLANSVSLSDLLHPETFLNALRQKSARQLGIAIDELKLVSSLEQGKLKSSGIVQLDGLWLQGCAFSRGQLADIDENASEILQLPTCFIDWISKAQPDPYPKQQTVETPVYHSLDREKLLCTLDLANNGSADDRVISGVALFLNGSD